MINKVKKNSCCVIEVILLVIVLIMLIIFAIGILYATPVIDDFNFYAMLKTNKYYPNLLLAAFSQATWMFQHMQGAWLTNVIDMFAVGITKLNPLGVRCYLVIGFILFSYAMFAITLVIKRLFPRDKGTTISLVFLASLIFVGMNLTPAREEIYWLTGVGGYTIPFSFALMGIKEYVELVDDYSTKKLILASVYMTLASGGALNIAGFICSAGVCILTLWWLKNKNTSLNKKHAVIMCIPLALGILSALVNVAAPGNFARLEFESSQGMNIPLALANTIKLVMSRVYSLYKGQYLILVSVILFLIVLKIGGEQIYINKSHLFFVLCSA